MADVSVTERVERVLLNHGVRSEDTVIVACSGGGDSVALAQAVHETGRTLIIAHVEHGIREGQSRTNECLAVDTLGERLNARVLRRTIPAGSIEVTARRENRSLEEVARRVRYRCLQEIALQVDPSGDTVIVTAHHRRDVFETLLMRLFTGRSAYEYSGIPEVRTLHDGITPVRVIRPFLTVADTHLHEYLCLHGLAAIAMEDPTNRDTRYLRNRIRAILDPALNDTFPTDRYDQALIRFTRDLERMRHALADLVPEVAWGEFGDTRWRVERARFDRLPSAAQELIVRKAVHHVSHGDRVAFRPFQIAIEGKEDTFASGLVLRWGERYLAIERDVVRPGRRGYLWRIRRSADITIMLTDGRVRVQESEDTDRVRWSFEPLTDPVVVRPRRIGETVRYRGEEREVSELLKRSPCSSHVRSVAPVLEDRDGFVAILDCKGPIFTRDGVQYRRETKPWHAGIYSLGVKCEDIGEYAERE